MNHKTIQRLPKLLAIAALCFFAVLVYALWTANFGLLLKLGAVWVVMLPAFVAATLCYVEKEDRRR